MIPIRKQGVIIREESDGNSIVFDSDSSSLFIMNSVGRSIFLSADGNHDLAGIAAVLKSSYSNICSICKNDKELESEIEKYLNLLEKNRLIRFRGMDD